MLDGFFGGDADTEEVPATAPPARPVFGPGPAPVLLDPAGLDTLPPAVDVDGDGLLDTVAFSTEAALVVATDADGDGWFDRVTELGDDGRFGVWQCERDADGTQHWTRIDEGRLSAGT